MIKQSVSGNPIVIHLILFVFLLCIFSAGASADKKIPFIPDDTLQTIRQKIKQNNYSFTVKDYTAELGKNYFKPGRHAPLSMQKWMAKLPARPLEIKTDLPKQFDWRNVDGKSYIGPVRNQGNTGSCYSFGTLSAAECLFNIAANRFNENCVNFSESYIMWVLGNDNFYSSHFSGGNGSDYDYYELTGITRLGLGAGIEGVCFENDFPYMENTPDNELVNNSLHYPKISFDSWSRIYPPDYKDTTNAIKTAILQNGAVVVSVLTSPAFDSYEKGVYEDTFTEPNTNPYYYYATDHEVSVVGWDDNPPEGGEGCWILRNSWGEDWGEKGYMRIRYGSAGVNLSTCYLWLDPASSYAMTSRVLSATRNSAVISGLIKVPKNTAVSYCFAYGESDTLTQKTPIQKLEGNGNQLIYEVTGALEKLKLGSVYSYKLIFPDEQKPDDSIVKDATPGEEGDAEETIQKEIATGKIQQFLLSGPKITSEGTEQSQYTLHTEANGSIVTNDIPAKVYLEYGETRSLGKTTDPQMFMRDTAFKATLDELKPNSKYYYRLVADNGAGVSKTTIETVTAPDYIFYDGFEMADTGDAKAVEKVWNQKYLLGGEEVASLSYYWDLGVAGISIPKQTPTEPFSGSKNARFSFYGQNFTLKDYKEESGGIGRLYTEPLDLGYFDHAYLSFAYAQPAWDGVQDTLKVYYKNSKDGEWSLLSSGEFTNEVREWRKQTFSLPNLSKTYQIMFEGTGNFGWGIVLDEVSIHTKMEETGLMDWVLY